MSKMHENEIEITEKLVRDLLIEQCPQWTGLELSRIDSSGTDHALFRLGGDKVMRLLRVEWSPGSNGSINKEVQWLPTIARHLSFPISEPIFKGVPNSNYPWYWTVVKWNEGKNPDFEITDEYVFLATDMAQFLNEFHQIPLKDGPRSRRGVPLKNLGHGSKNTYFSEHWTRKINPLCVTIKARNLFFKKWVFS